MLDHQDPRRGVLISRDVGFPFAVFADGDQRSPSDIRACHAFARTLVFGVHQQSKVSRVGKQPSLSWLNGIEEALASKRVAVQNIEAAAVQRESARVAQPKSSQRTRNSKGFVPEGDLLRCYFRL